MPCTATVLVGSVAPAETAAGVDPEVPLLTVSVNVLPLPPFS